MSNPFKKKIDTALEAQIASVYADLQGWTAETEEYKAALKRLETLYRLRDGVNAKREVDLNVAIPAAASLLGILVITQHERAAVVTSKALSFIKFK